MIKDIEYYKGLLKKTLPSLQWYSGLRYSFANDIAQVGYRMANGDIPTVEQVREAWDQAEEIDALIGEITSLNEEEKCQ